MKNFRVFLAGLGFLSFLIIPSTLFSYDNSPARQIFIPECIWAQASGGGTWVTELQITAMNPGTEVGAMYYYGKSNMTISNIWTSSSLKPYCSVKFSNILSTLKTLYPYFEFYGTVGTLRLYTQNDSLKIQAQAKIINGNYGKTFPGLNYVDANTANLNRNMRIMDLTQNATYRTFVGFFNAATNSASMTVQFAIIDANNNVIGNMFIKTFGYYDFMSFNPFVEAAAGSGAYDNCWLYIMPTSSGSSGPDSKGLFCFGSVANNVTNDSAALIAVQFQ